jgi:ribonucleotide reductase beta subunit family protein with ferritin-like domain
MSTTINEPILDENNRRYTMFPIQYHSIWKLYKEQLSSFWKAEEVDFSQDYDDFLKLNDNEQLYIKRVLAFFAASDGIVNFNLSKRFLNDIKIMEALTCYGYQMMIENVHSETYSLMLDNIVRDPHEKEMMFNAIKTIESIKMMGDWAFKWIESDLSFAHRVVAFAVIEGLFFSSSFLAIFWIKNYKGAILNGLTTSNEFIARDEGQHVQFACELYRLLNHKLTSDEVYEIVDDGLKISKIFTTDALPVRLIGMNSESVCDYLEYVADCLLVGLGYNKKYNKANPFEFMKNIGMQSKNNFFEMRGTSYSSAYGQNRTKGRLETLDDDF